MKIVISIIIILTVFLTACTKKTEVVLAEEIIPTEKLLLTADKEVVSSFNSQEMSKTMYVSTPDGLRVRDYPDINANRIAVLENQAKIFATKEIRDSIIIDGIKGNWTFIEYDDIQGWVFGGYLSLMPPYSEYLSSLPPYIGILYHLFFDVLKMDDNRGGAISDRFNTDNYRIIKQRTALDGRGWSAEDKANMPDNIILSFVEYDQFMIAYIYSQINTPNKEWILRFEVKIDNTNYLHLFPYKTVPEILDVLKDCDPSHAIYGAREWHDESGSYAKNGDEYISFTWGGDYWMLFFKDGILSSIMFLYPES